MKHVAKSRQFEKHYKKRIAPNQKLDSQFEERLALFLSGYNGHPLNDHALIGKLKGKRAFSITSDIRVIYEETADTVLLLDIGAHNQVYR